MIRPCFVRATICVNVTVNEHHIQQQLHHHSQLATRTETPLSDTHQPTNFHRLQAHYSITYIVRATPLRFISSDALLIGRRCLPWVGASWTLWKCACVTCSTIRMVTARHRQWRHRLTTATTTTPTSWHDGNKSGLNCKPSFFWFSLTVVYVARGPRTPGLHHYCVRAAKRPTCRWSSSLVGRHVSLFVGPLRHQHRVQSRRLGSYGCVRAAETGQRVLEHG